MSPDFTPLSPEPDNGRHSVPGLNVSIPSPLGASLRDTVHDALSASPFVSAALVDALKIDPRIEQLFAGPGCAGCSYDLETHTLRVMGQFEKYFSNIQLPAALDRGVMRLTLALHDIGKPIAMAQSRDQHHCTLEVIQRLAPDLPIDAREMAILQALIDGDPMGALFQGHCTVDEASAEVRSMATRSGLSLPEFLPLLIMFYQSDTSGYTRDAGAPRRLDHYYVPVASGGLTRTSGGERLLFTEPTEGRFRSLVASLSS